MMSNTATRYGAVARTLHWLIALMILTNLALGWIGGALPRTAETVGTLQTLYSTHKTIGVAVLGLAIFRVIWAFTQKRPVPVHPERKVETLVAETVHWTLYVAIFLLPISGWVLHSSEVGFAPIWWPFAQALPMVPQSESVAHAAARLHGLAGYVVAGLAALHVAGALKHAVIDKDGTLDRMLRGKSAGNPNAAGGNHAIAAIIALLFWIAVVGVANFAFAPEEDHDAIATASDPAPTAPETEAPTVAPAADAPAVDAPAVDAPAVDAEAVASGWAVQDGTLAITVKQMGAEVEGGFDSWDATIEYDPETGEGVVRTAIDTTTVNLGSVTQQATGPEFFDSETYKQAVFEGDISRVEGSAHVAEGTLTLVGQTVPVTLNFELEVTGDLATMTGGAVLDRRDFGIGAGYEDEATVGYSVEVDVSLTAQQTQ